MNSLATRLTVRALMLAATAVTPFVPSAAFGQTNERVIEFNIPASDLSQALRVYMAQSGEQIMYSDRVIRGNYTAGVRGPARPSEALRLLLKSSGVAVARGSQGVWIIRPISDALEYHQQGGPGSGCNSKAAQGRARPGPLRGAVMERSAPTRADVHDRSRLPPVPSAQASQKGGGNLGPAAETEPAGNQAGYH